MKWCSQLHPDAVLYRQLNLYAHERFPEDMAFVHNLLNAYARIETYDAAAADRLLRQYWFYDAALRSRLFEKLSAQGRLYPELAADSFRQSGHHRRESLSGSGGKSGGGAIRDGSRNLALTF